MIAFWDMMPTFAELAGTDETPTDIDGISVAAALRGEEVQAPHEYLYWDYGHNRETYHQAVRMGDWKGVRHGEGGRIELYDLSEDLAESHDIATQHAEIVSKIEQLLRTAVTPSHRYEVGKLYEGGPIWQSQAVNSGRRGNDQPTQATPDDRWTVLLIEPTSGKLQTGRQHKEEVQRTKKWRPL